MSYPIWAYLLGLVLVIPVLIGVGILAVMIIRLALEWLTTGESDSGKR